MSKKIEDDNGDEIEVYTAEEMKAATEAAIKTKEEEFGKTKIQIEAERDEAKKALGERTTEFGQFRKLKDEAVEKLSVAERTLYENQKYMAEDKEKREKEEKDKIEKQVDATIRSKVGTDEKLFEKVKNLYSTIGIDATTPEEIEKKTLMSMGALNISEPNLLASIGFSGGSFTPPGEKKDDDKSFADTDRGKQGAGELGLKLEPDKEKK